MPVEGKIKALRGPLYNWNRVTFGHIDANINKYEAEVKSLELRSEDYNLDDVDSACLVAVQGQLRIRYDRKESYWRQLSRENFVKLNDKNTKYFHAMTMVMGRKRRNIIQTLKVGNRLVKGPRKVKNVAVRYFKNLYSQP